jgi:hypothetical protein
MFPARQISSLTVEFGGTCTSIKDISVLTGATRLPDEFYGNVGEDALSSFSSFTLDFHAMDFRVNGGNPDACTDRVTN